MFSSRMFTQIHRTLASKCTPWMTPQLGRMAVPSMPRHATPINAFSMAFPAWLATQAAASEKPPLPSPEQLAPLHVGIGKYDVGVSCFGVSKKLCEWPMDSAPYWKMEMISWRNIAHETLDRDRTLGEDACIVFPANETELVLGVADGVGGWVDSGVDPGIVSHLLMERVRDKASNGTVSSPRALLQQAFDAVLEQSLQDKDLAGSTTMCLSTLQLEPASDALTVHSVNVGDSGMVVVRDGKIVHHTEETSIPIGKERAPFQLAVIPPKFQDQGPFFEHTPNDGAAASFPLQPGDVCIYGSDGLLDNITITSGNLERIVGYVMDHQNEHNLSESDLATSIAGTLLQAALKGFKVDDITVMVATIQEQQAAE